LNSLLKLYALPARDKWLLAQSLVVLPANGLALRLMSFKRWRAILSRLTLFDGQKHSKANSEVLVARANKTATMVRAAAAYGPYRGNCLSQSLTVWWLLRCQNLESQIRFGARKENHKLEAHAWVEFHEIALTDGHGIDCRYAPFERLMTSGEVAR
jgi:Transglutaminase-like superfamily